MSSLFSKLAIGSAQFGMNYGIANKSGMVENHEMKKILDLAFQSGIDTIDTAINYADSEKKIGKYLLSNKSKNWKIITKISSKNPEPSLQFKESIKKLNTQPYALLIHSFKLFEDLDFQKLIIQLKKDYLIKIGISVYKSKEIKIVLDSNLKPDIIQLPLNILDSKIYKTGLLKLIKSQEMEIHVRSVFLQGLFYLSHDEVNKRFPDAVQRLNDLMMIAKKSNLTVAELSLLWIASLSEVDKIILGIDNHSQLNSHLNTLGKKVKPDIFNDALSIEFNNDKILNPTLWD